MFSDSSPTNQNSGHSGYYRFCWNITIYEAISTHNRTTADRNTLCDGYIRSDPYIIFNDHFALFIGLMRHRDFQICEAMIKRHNDNVGCKHYVPSY
ncbi:hypothetical protein ASS64_03550 [Erythrobacter sp. AP23]|nr:hypothetical protein ASS64_03550 [Erythrobacter sp. AP23]